MGLHSCMVFSRSSAGEFVALCRPCVVLPFSEPVRRGSGHVLSQTLVWDRTAQGSSASCFDFPTGLGGNLLSTAPGCRKAALQEGLGGWKQSVKSTCYREQNKCFNFFWSFDSFYNLLLSWGSVPRYLSFTQAILPCVCFFCNMNTVQFLPF